MLTAAKLSFLVASVSPLLAAPHRYRIVPSPGSHFALEVEKTGLMAGKKHHFEFSRYNGTLNYDPENASSASVDLTIESASAVCQDTWINAKDLQKVQRYALEDMLAAGQFPKLVFRSTAIRKITDSSFEVDGMLTIRDQTQRVPVTVKLESADATGTHFSGIAKISLKSYGLKPPTAALGAIGTKDEMTVLFQLLAATER